jgi:hypothetical protein
MSPLPIVRCASALATDSINGLSPQNWAAFLSSIHFGDIKNTSSRRHWLQV